MAAHLFSLRGVTAEEAEAIRQLLTAHDIDFYETPAGSWGISAGAIWLRHKDDLETAQRLLQEFHRDWSAQQQARHQDMKRAGELPGFVDSLRARPLKVIVYLGVALLILYLSTKPFLSIGN